MTSAPMTWGALQLQRAERIVASRAASAALLAGDRGPAKKLLETWSFASDRPRLHSLISALLAAEINPPGWVVDAALHPDLGALPRPYGLGPRLMLWDFRQELVAHCASTRRDAPAPDRETAMAWALDELNLAGGEVGRRRIRWSARDWKVDKQRDGLAAKLWAGWLAGGPAWGTMRLEATRALLLKPAAKAIREELARLELKVPPDTLRELDNDLFFLLMLPPKSGPGARPIEDLALRVLETAGDGPIRSLCARLPDQALGWASECATHRGAGRRSATLGWPELSGPAGRATSLWMAQRQDPTALDQALDLHTALRLVQVWRRGGRSWLPDPSRAVILANRGRGRARLRALAATVGGTWLAEQLLALPGLWARTRAAARWFGTDLARQERGHDLTLSLDRPVLPPCRRRELPPPPLGAEDERAVDCWLFVVACQGHWRTLRTWVQDGRSTQGGTWGRLLSKALPASLTDAGRGGGADATYDRLRAYLRSTWEIRVQVVRARVDEIIGLRPRTRRRREQCLDRWWCPEITRPSGPLFEAAMSPEGIGGLRCMLTTP